MTKLCLIKLCVKHCVEDCECKRLCARTIMYDKIVCKLFYAKNCVYARKIVYNKIIYIKIMCKILYKKDCAYERLSVIKLC